LIIAAADMTRIDFYTKVDDKFRFACKLCAKAATQHVHANVFTRDEAATTRLDQMLWTVPATGFIPHCRADSDLAAETPILIHHAPVEFLHDDLLINLSDERPPFFGRFHRLIEIVSSDEADAALARERYRFYRDRGYELTSHDMSRNRE
jgi:DNA polymerase-3 subunit chi